MLKEGRGGQGGDSADNEGRWAAVEKVDQGETGRSWALGSRFPALEPVTRSPLPCPSQAPAPWEAPRPQVLPRH